MKISSAFERRSRGTLFVRDAKTGCDKTEVWSISRTVYDHLGRSVAMNDERFVYDGYLCIKKVTSRDSCLCHNGGMRTALIGMVAMVAL